MQRKEGREVWRFGLAFPGVSTPAFVPVAWLEAVVFVGCLARA